MKKLISAALAGAMMLSSVPCMAADINITIDNEEFIPKNALGEVVEPFIENGSTYLPVRAMGEAVGKAVKFDAENYAVYIGEEPADEDKGRDAYMLVGDRVFYEEDLTLYGDMEMLVLAEKIATLAREKFTQSEIDSMASQVYASIEPETLKEIKAYGDYVLNEFINYTAYLSLLQSSVVVDDSVYENYVTAQHILVEDETTAKEVLDKITAGEDFAKLIEEYNVDPGQSKDSSYTFTYGEMVAEFEKAAFALEEGTYTKEAVATEYGYHIIKRLPLDKASVDTDSYIYAELDRQLNEIEFDKVVEIKREGDYGNLEGFNITTDDLVILGGQYASYSEMFSVLESITRMKIFFVQEDMLSDEEKAVIEKTAEEYKESFYMINDEEKAIFLAELTGYYAVFMDKYYTGKITDEQLEKIDVIEIDSMVYKDIKVFVDGKLIVPADVNNNYVAPKNIDGTVYVPVRAIVEALGMKADWDNDTRTVVITK